VGSVRGDAPPGEDLGPPPPQTRRHALLSPGAIGLHMFALLVTALCVLAGSWQLDAWRNEQALESADRSGAEPVPVAELLDVDTGLRSDVVGRRVVAEGTYAPAEEQLLVAGREHEGRTGWWVLSPLLVAEDTALLVVRGWTGEEELPSVPQGQVSVTVSVQPGEESRDGARVAATGDVPVVDVVRLPSLVNELPYRLYPAYGLRIDEQPPPDDGLTPVAPPDPETSWRTGARSLAYALQWWLFAAFAVFMWWRILSDRLRSAPDREATATTP
jgi:cytochrome oxidase assembly protein ShyY1